MKPPSRPVALAFSNLFLRLFAAGRHSDAQTKVNRRRIACAHGGRLTLRVFTPSHACEMPAPDRNPGAYAPDDGLPCLVFIHGGGFTMRASSHHYAMAKRYAVEVPCVVVSADYRLAPRHPFPTPVEDCYAAYAWVVAHATEIGCDPARIAIGGDSAGGCYAAAVALMARDRALPLPCFQMLVYPMTDRRMITSSVARFSDTPMWNSALNRRSWELYLQDQPLVDGHAADADTTATSASAAVSASTNTAASGAASAACSAPAGSTASARTASSAPAYASPAEAYDLKGLPDAYVETAEFDCLHDEGAAYARRLAIDGAQVELNQTEGTVHGFDMVMGSPLVQTCIARRVDALRRAFVRQMTLRVASEWDLDESLRG